VRAQSADDFSAPGTQTQSISPLVLHVAASIIGDDAASAVIINPFISISTFTQHIAKMVFDRRLGFFPDCFAVGALTSGACY
jgi:hypothetical protein